MDREQLIEKYLQGRLTPAEQEQFDRLLVEDADFKKEVTFQKDVARVAEAEDSAEFEALLNEFEATHTQPPSQRTNFKWLAAASIILLLGAAYFFWPEKSDSSQELFAEYYEPYRNVVHPIVRNSQEEDAKTTAFLAYEQGNYAEALARFDELYKNETVSYYLFYKANALIALDREEEAIELLEVHLNSSDVLVERAPWYLAMAYLKLDDKANAKKWLREVITRQQYKVDAAKELLSRLE